MGDAEVSDALLEMGAVEENTDVLDEALGEGGATGGEGRGNISGPLEGQTARPSSRDRTAMRQAEQSERVFWLPGGRARLRGAKSGDDSSMDVRLVVEGDSGDGTVSV
eukprot:Cvel_19166.t1-p1 / transcript=Cvel_19166.t1 / gene=Cvel_19166 / organism=Chromera_velia_CCMP2878 / gene_product=hypothetical protein / transcript_product=hypothetical protein / location=Cvel_scaffold1633:941-1261(+) / protein_length=107 / sequence_SO=supercontig / SO=protein_coding / is_pseudo=false